jgi:hypothetical protein
VSHRPDFSTRPKPPRARPLDLALAGAAALFAALAGYEALQARAALTRDREAVREARRQLENVRSRAVELEARRPRDGRLTASQVRLTVEAPPPRIAAEVAALMPPDVRLDSLDLSYGDRLDVAISVVARSAGAYDRLLDRLSEAPLFQNVLPGAESREGEVRAQIRMTWAGTAR